MILRDYHTHTTFCDGKGTPREMADAAIERGLDTLGFSVHSTTPFHLGYCILPEQMEQYKAEIAALKKEYDGRLEILCGIEQDIFTPYPPEGFDYIIGSVHYLPCPDGYFPIDHSPRILSDAANKYYGGDMISLAEHYFGVVSEVADKTGPDIIGHFDLVTKFNEGGKMFDENDSRYVAAWRAATDKLLEHNIPFEINSGAIHRGYRTHPYPSREQQHYINSRGGKFILSSDSHSTATLCHQFDKWYSDKLNIIDKI